MAPLEAPSADQRRLGHARPFLGSETTAGNLANISPVCSSDYQPQKWCSRWLGELSLLGFFVDALANDESDFDAFAIPPAW